MWRSVHPRRVHIAILKPRIKQRQSSGRSLSSVSPGLTIHQRARGFGTIFSISSTESLGARASEDSSEEVCGLRIVLIGPRAHFFEELVRHHGYVQIEVVRGHVECLLGPLVRDTSQRA